MNPFKSIWWSLMASMKGMSYEDYIDYKIKKIRKEIEDLPDVDNFLSFLLEYYSFKSIKRSIETLMFISIVGLLTFVITNYFNYSFVQQLIASFFITQLVLFIIGFYLKHKYK